MTRKRPTVHDLLSWKGQRQLSMLRIFTLDEAAAAEAAGIDIVSAPPELVTHPEYRNRAPSLFSMTGLTHLEAGTPDDYLRFSGEMLGKGADALYCSGSFETVARLSREHIPIVGHVGIVPARVTWTGGYRAVGKTAAEALEILDQCRRFEEAGAIAVEIEVVPQEVATEISARMKKLLLWSMGSGPGCDAQYLFAEDILGETRGRVPRHAQVYRNFAAEYERLQAERIAAFSEFIADIESGAFPARSQVVSMPEDELSAFRSALG
ncbi:3-methyl-2-oxobutanoate hydroxymethyltransferase [Roseisalinus antarcticus]|uniref:3-methyl-2-oxobutanoate hydroxymethyltransferase n=1 Tax=Roseisalinus antarcticus TaxID=254357 RepID=A0A1Y5TDU6_9RHOB|nr:3-methyl-2-oxobutanoate hydroxymethyltransferase [Roseisalinus antarcticus]SLN61459.1 3-methyl-2-oxobutanoate hydroxymethyltransferase [Roseisalinus antarcticus]